MDADVRDEQVTLRGLSFHYRDWGGQGQSAVLLHGLASTCRTWDLVAPYLRQGFRVVALDQRGHGLSAKPQDGYNFPNFTEDLHAFLNALELQRPLLVGQSFGANVVLHYGAEYPQEAMGLVLVDGGVGDLSARPWEQVERDLAPPDLTSFTPEQLLKRIESGSSLPWSPEREAILLSIFEVTPKGTITPNLRRENHMKILRAMWETPSAAQYHRVSYPVLLIPARQQDSERSEERQRSKTESVTRAQESLTRCRVVWMEDSIHDVQLQRPEALAQTIFNAVDDGFFHAVGEAQAPALG